VVTGCFELSATLDQYKNVKECCEVAEKQKRRQDFQQPRRLLEEGGCENQSLLWEIKLYLIDPIFCISIKPEI